MKRLNRTQFHAYILKRGFKKDLGVTIGISVGLGIVVLIGLWVFALGARNVYRGFTSRSWPVTEGIVTESASSVTHERDRNNRSSTMYLPKTTVRFTVNGHSFETETRQFGQFEGSGDESFSVLELRRFPLGKVVTVSYNPANPSVATAMAGFTASAVVLPLAGVAFLAMALLAWVATRSDDTMTSVVTVFALIFCSIGVGFLVPGSVALWRAHSSKRWPTTNALIVYGTPANGELQELESAPNDSTRTRVRTVDGDTLVTSTAAHLLVYRYDVGGEHRYGNRRQFGQLAYSSTESWTSDIAARYVLGRRVPVSYSPTNPEMSVLQPGFTNDALYLPGAGLAFLLFGLAALVFAAPALSK